MVEQAIDAKQLIYMPLWAKILCITVLLVGLASSIAIIFRFFGDTAGLDWLLIGISGVQFIVTTLVVAIILFVSQTDANINTLERRSDQFLRSIFPEFLARVSLGPDDHKKYTATFENRSDIFEYSYKLIADGEIVLRLWCGLNVRRLIVIYQVRNPHPEKGTKEFVEQLEQIFSFCFGGAKSVGYHLNFEPIPSMANVISIWLTVDTQTEILTDPTAKLFWAQDIAMMTESFYRTAARHRADVVIDTEIAPYPK